jgi:hypothetical protein
MASASSASLASSALVALAIVLGTSSARADATCISAYEQTQTLRKDGKPVAAKAQAAVCAQTSCPALLTKDCSKWLAELEAVIPSVILDPRSAAGGLRADVRVKLDGVALAEKIDGKPLVVEPGAHTFVFEADGAAPAERTITLHEGDKNKKITVTLAPAAEPRSDERPIPTGVWIFGGVSVVALAASAVFAIDALGKKSDLDQCKPRCAPDDVDSMSARFTMADVALGAGVMAGAAALYLFFTRPTAEANPANGAARTSAGGVAAPFATPLPGGGAVGFTTRF